jgi:hypothetical protein
MRCYYEYFEYWLVFKCFKKANTDLATPKMPTQKTDWKSWFRPKRDYVELTMAKVAKQAFFEHFYKLSSTIFNHLFETVLKFFSNTFLTFIEQFFGHFWNILFREYNQNIKNQRLSQQST